MAEFQNSRPPLHKVALRVDFGTSLVASAVESMRAMRIEDEIVPDSEEERLQRSKAKRHKAIDRENADVIELTSDEEEEEYIHVRRLGAGRTPRARRIVQSSDSEDYADNGAVSVTSLAQVQVPQPTAARRGPLSSTGPVIDLTGSSSESESEEIVPAKAGRAKPVPQPASRSAMSHRPTSSLDDEKGIIPLYADDNSDDDDPANANDGSVLVLNEPRSARKPLRVTNLSYPDRKLPSASLPSTPIRRIVSIHSTDSESEMDARSEASVRSAKPAATPKKTKAAGTKAPKLSKKALEAAEQQRRERYARTFFEEMNRTVFEGGLPGDTQLVWNVRLLSTAGKAKWKRDRNGVQTTAIELAIKILTSEERIRNTLSHEMCHLATWIISDAPEENHGKIFHGWAKKVMRERPDIEVTTKHSYEIIYKYEWKCQNCDKIYGRFSKSIKPEECVCGACKAGKLLPLFTTRAPRTPRNKAGSAMASAKGRDSPITMSSPFRVPEEAVNIRLDIHVPPGALGRTWPATTKTHTIPGAFPLDDDEDRDEDESDDVQELARALGDVRI